MTDTTPKPDVHQTQRRISAVRSSPHQAEVKETDRLCTQCNRILLRREKDSICICQNGHVHEYPSFKFLYGV